MSDELQLSRELIDQVQQAVVAHDERAKDPFIGSQYLSAIIGFLVGNTSLSNDDKSQIIDELSGFMRHVFEDIAGQQQQQAAPAAPVAPPGSAFGIWKPGQD